MTASTADFERLAEKLSEAAAIKCPSCGEPLSFETTAKLMDSSRMSFTITPHEGELLGAKTVAGSMGGIVDLLTAVGKNMGVHTNVLISGLRFDAGAVTVELLVARSEKGVGKRRVRKNDDRTDDATAQPSPETT